MDTTWHDGFNDGEELGRALLHGSECCVSLYWRENLLEKSLLQFGDAKFYRYDFDCSEWKRTPDFHDAFFKQMNFPSYYGRNLNAFNDSFGDAIVTDKLGVVIALRHYDHFHEKNRDASTTILNIMQKQAWHCLLDGKLLVVLLQSDDPMFCVEIGKTVPSWNMDEWLNADRGL